MARPSPQKIVDLRHFLTRHGSIAAEVRREALFFGDLASFGTAIASGKAALTPMRCRRRPGRKACPGLLSVFRQDAPPAVLWECPDCGAGGMISGWQGTAWDLVEIRSEVGGQTRDPIRISIAAHAALRELAHEDQRWREPVYTARVVDGEVQMDVASVERDHLTMAALLAVLQRSGRRNHDRLVEAMAALVPRDALEAARAEDDEMSDAEFEDMVAEMTAELVLPVQDTARSPRHELRRRRKGPTGTYRIKVTLRGARPPIWRRLLVPADITLLELHLVLQTAMGWLDCHLHQFVTEHGTFAPPYPDVEPLGEDSRNVTLSEVAPAVGDKLVYEYDFGDYWCHDIRVEEILDEPCERMRCLAGRRAGPPEDCGGVWGYERLCEAIADPEHEEHAELREWVGPHFAPELFSVEELDSELARIRRSPRRGPSSGKGKKKRKG